MGFMHKLLLFSHLASLALCDPQASHDTESGGGVAPWAGTGPEPASSDSSANRVAFAAADSSVPVGSIIDRCTQPGTVALTFDDGPHIYTAQILDTLRANNVRATFFINGDNWSNIFNADNQALVRRMIAEGHQIGSHTYVEWHATVRAPLTLV